MCESHMHSLSFVVIVQQHWLSCTHCIVVGNLGRVWKSIRTELAIQLRLINRVID